ncbi:MAG TPA: hypothetical protein VL688_09135 [Verrucomicrobiae bacterium]|jgi:hypothetical protein|nr:hypothetical protein [Verrucomicrobiae bacterium]
MMTEQKITRLAVVAGAGAAFLFAGWGISQDEGLSWWNASFAAYLILIPWTAFGMLKFRYRSMVIGNFLTAGLLAFGVYAAHFAWSFWLFKEPTVTDRILALFRPQVFCLVAGPVIWFLYFSRRSVRQLFS